MEKLYLKIPQKEEMEFKKNIKEDPATMDYNAGYELSFKGYNRKNGTIKTSLKELKEIWFPKWIKNWPKYYYTYIVRKEDNKNIGEIYAKWDEAVNAYEIGIVIKGEFRGKGYSTEAINLLLQDLKNLGAKRVFHLVPDSRKAVIKAELNNGFKIIKEKTPGLLKFGELEFLTLLEKEI